jgi:hypothetical protein
MVPQVEDAQVLPCAAKVESVEPCDDLAETKACAGGTDAGETKPYTIVMTGSIMQSSVREEGNDVPVGAAITSFTAQRVDSGPPFKANGADVPRGIPDDPKAMDEPDSLNERDPVITEITVKPDDRSENLDEAIVLSFDHDHELLSETASKRKERTNHGDPPTRSTARRVQTLLNGRYEIGSDDEAKGVQNVVRRIERKLIARRRIVTGNRYYKVSRVRQGDASSSDASSSTTSEVKSEPMNLACRLILRLASSESEVGPSSSEDSSTVSGSLNLSLSCADMTKSDDSKRSEDMHSFVLMFRQLRAIESRQQKLERRFQDVFVGPSERERRGPSKRDRVVERMQEIGQRQVVIPDKKEQERLKAEYKRLEKEMERYGATLMLSDFHRDELVRRETKWEEDNAGANLQALKQIRRHMPVNVRTMSLKALASTVSPNGNTLPERVARKFKVTTILQLLRIDPKDIERLHPSVLEDLRMVDLTLVERRALHSHLRGLGPAWTKRKAGMFGERRWAWYEMLKNNFKEELLLHSDGNAVDDAAAVGRRTILLNPAAEIDYSEDYGFPDGDEYELLTPSMRRGDLNDFGKTLNELKTTDEEPEADFLGPLIERMKEMDLETLRFHDEIATLEETIKSLGICHSIPYEAHREKEVSSTDSRSSESITS